MLRNLSKVASTASAAATAAVVSVSSAATNAEFPMKKYRDNSNSRLSKPYPGPNYIEDEYDFCHEENYGSYMAGVPTQEEVEEATRDLQATFVQNESYRSSRSLKHKMSDVEATPDVNAVCSSSEELCHEDQDIPMPTASPAGSSPGSRRPGPSIERKFQAMAVRGNNNVVAHCVDLLQRDPDIQAAVVSLAKDPAVWDAFVKNEKVQELLQSRSVKLPSVAGPSREASLLGSNGGKKHERENPFIIALLCAKNMVFEMMDTLVDLVGNVFGFFDQKIFGSKDSDPLDKPLKACMVLTILVLALVVLKRV